MNKWIDLIVRLLVIGIIALCFVGAAYCQSYTEKAVKHLSLHTDQEEFEDSMAIKVIKIMSFDKNLIYWSKETRKEVKLSSFAYDSRTKLPDNFFKNPQGCYIAVYCKKHLMLYTLTPLKC